MPITTLTYEAPVRRSSSGADLDFELFEQAIALYEDGRALESLTKTFEHLFPQEKLPNLASEVFSFTQGSSHVTTKIENDHVTISVPLVKLPEGGSAIAALRYVLSNISSTGQLYHPRLRGDDIHIEFRERLTRLHPAKIVEVLRRMPVEADDNDDFLIGQFKALPLDRAPIDDVTDAEFAQAEKIWRQHWADIEELVKECQKKRSMFFLNETTAYALHRIGFTLPLSGFLTSRINEAASTFNDTDEDPMKRETVLGKCAKEMKAVSAEDLRKSLGHSKYAISPLDNGSPDVIDGNIGPGDYMETIAELRKNGKSFEAALALFSTYNFLLARFNWPEEIVTELQNGLAQASGKPWREAAKILFEHATSVAEQYGDDGEDEEEEEEDGEEEDGEEGEEEGGDDEEEEEADA